jgi:ribosomal protein S27E
MNIFNNFDEMAEEFADGLQNVAKKIKNLERKPHEVKCQNCGARVIFDNSKDINMCAYCGSVVCDNEENS